MLGTRSVCLVAALALASSAHALGPPPLDAPLAARSASLLVSHGGARFSPGIHGPDSSDLVLNGLLLVGAGLVAGAAGFAIMAACPQGGRCYSDTLNTVAWVLAAPGLIPIVVGVFLIYLGSPSRHGDLLTPDLGRRWAFTF